MLDHAPHTVIDLDHWPDKARGGLLSRAAVVGVLLTVSAPAFGQETLWSFPAETPGTAEVGPDMDGDGVPEILVGDPAREGPARPGRVHVVSGASAALLRTWQGVAVGDHFGSAIARLGDVDGDRVPDIAIGAPGPTHDPSHRPYVRVVSGADGTSIHQLLGPSQLSEYGTALAALGDVDGDGVPDLAVAASGTANAEAGFAEVLSLATGARIWRSATLAPGGAPVALARHGDLDGDAGSELLVGFAGLDRAEILAGATGAGLSVLLPPAGVGFGEALGFGAAVAARVDLDGDDLEDALVGAPDERLTPPPSSGSYEGWVATGSVYAYSGASGLLFRAPGDEFQQGFGTSVAVVGDMDGDGTGDFVTGSAIGHWGCCHYDVGREAVCSGRDGAVMYVAGVGGVFRAVGDWDGDSWPDYLVSSPLPSFVAQSSPPATEIRAGAQPQLPVNSACAGSTGSTWCSPYMGFVGAPKASSTEPFIVWGANFEHGSRGVLLFGLDQQFLPFAPGASGALCVAKPVARFSAESNEMPFACLPTAHTASLRPELFQNPPFAPGSSFIGQLLSLDGSSHAIQGTTGSFRFTVQP